MRLEWRVHGYHWSKGVVHNSRVKNRTLFSLFGLVPIIFLLSIMLAACGGSSPSTSGPGVSAIDNVYSPKELHIILIIARYMVVLVVLAWLALSSLILLPPV